MNSPASQEIVARFFEALQYLINDGQVKSRNSFCTKHGIRQGNLWKAENNHASQIFQIGWLTPLITEYSISANWIMTGSGSMVFKSPPDGSRKLAPIPPNSGE